MGIIRITFYPASALIILVLEGCTAPKTNEPPVNLLSPDVVANVVASTLCSSNGSYTSKQYNLSLTCDIQDTVDRTVHLWNHNLGAGTINVAANGTGPSNQPYAYTGLVTFVSGTNNCDFVFNGMHYLFDLVSGSLQKQ